MSNVTSRFDTAILLFSMSASVILNILRALPTAATTATMVRSTIAKIVRVALEIYADDEEFQKELGRK